MDRLAPEILCDIFLKSLPHRRGDPCAAVPASVSAPLHLSHVCQTWREISISCGELWSHLYIDYETPNGLKKWKSWIEVFDSRLSRTKNSPLNFSFHCFMHGGLEDEVHRGAEYIITTLLAEQHRWGNVNFFWFDVNVSAEFPGIHAINMPMLTSLALSFELKTHDREPICASIDLAHSARLRRLRVDGSYHLINSGSERILTLTEPSRLTFTIDCSRELAARSCLNFLKAAPRLTEFCALIECFDDELPLQQFVPADGQFLVLPDLQTLELDCGGQATYILDNLTAPSLKALHYQNYSVGEGENFVKFIQRSLPPLELLAVLGGVEVILVAALRQLPTLKDLRVSNVDLSIVLLRELTVTNISKGDNYSVVAHECTLAICPTLQSLRLSDVKFLGDKAECMEGLSDMLKSRWGNLGSFEAGRRDPSRKPFERDRPGRDVTHIDQYIDELQHCVQQGYLHIQGDASRLHPFHISIYR